MNTIEEQQIIKAAREAEHRRQAILDKTDFKAIIDTAEGRRFIRRVLAECGVHKLSYNFTDTGSNTAFKEGKRSIGLWLQSLFVDCPDQYIQLLKEESQVRASD
ncbi:hypothetical protein QZJ86_12105 [Methylomonas montana]|uniref:Bbp19 family protein n=1 Tax=Methylomonas montana TaxID=3058963 RepID=UPI00265AE75B|nr:hypothetical protein [Methylomonas montana]WKJ88765.1 hypothetical protein QZJ86_12105 [Methylomonas montana]